MAHRTKRGRRAGSEPKREKQHPEHGAEQIRGRDHRVTKNTTFGSSAGIVGTMLRDDVTMTARARARATRARAASPA